MIKTILKFTVAGAIIFWMARNDQIDFSLITKSLQHPKTWAIALSILLVNEFLTSWRWKILLEIKSKRRLPFLPVIKLTWIGMLFSSVLPGAVTGDLVKAVYARGLDPKLSRSFLLTSVAFDRIIGLIGLILLLGISSLIFYSEMVAFSPAVKRLVHINFLILAGALGFITSFFLPQKLHNFIIKFFGKTPIIGNKLEDLFQQVWLIGRNKVALFKGIGISITSQMSCCIALWTLSTPFVENAIPLRFAFSFIPLGLITIAIPITPAGLGVGHAAFATLFSYFGSKSGASIFNLFFIAIQGINLMGIFPFMTTNRKKLIHHQRQTASSPQDDRTDATDS